MTALESLLHVCDHFGVLFRIVLSCKAVQEAPSMAGHGLLTSVILACDATRNGYTHQLKADSVCCASWPDCIMIQDLLLLTALTLTH